MQSFLTPCGVIISLLALVAVVFAHGDEPHDGAAPDTAGAVSSLTDTIAVNWDSILAVVGEGFVALQPVFQRACYDCHSANTRYPWYYKLPLVRGLIDEDIREARTHLDLTDGYPFKGHGRRADDLLAIKGALEDGKMPPLKYRLLHWNAKPSKNETDAIVAWVDQSLRLLAAHGQYPLGRADLVPGAPLVPGAQSDTQHVDSPNGH